METAFSVLNNAKFSSLFHLIGQIYTSVDNLAPVGSIGVENVTQKFRHSGKVTDKGGAIVLWRTSQYLNEAHKQLHNTNHYRKVQHNPIPSLVHDIT